MRVISVEAIKEWRDRWKNQGKERKGKERRDTTWRMRDGWPGSDGGDCSK